MQEEKKSLWPKTAQTSQSTAQAKHPLAQRHRPIQTRKLPPDTAWVILHSFITAHPNEGILKPLQFVCVSMTWTCTCPWHHDGLRLAVWECVFLVRHSTAARLLSAPITEKMSTPGWKSGVCYDYPLIVHVVKKKTSLVGYLVVFSLV